MTEPEETTIEVSPDSDAPDTERYDFQTVDTGRTRTRNGPMVLGPGSPKPDGGVLHVITAAARTPGVGLIAGYEGADFNGAGAIELGLADGLAIRVVSRLDKHRIAVPVGETPDDPTTWPQVDLRYLPAAAVTNPRANLGVVMPDDWNAVTGGPAFGIAGLEREVLALEQAGLKIRHRLYVAATPSTMAVHFGTLAERVDLFVAARDVMRAGGTVQIEAGAMTPLDACAATRIAPWAGYVDRFNITIVVPCGNDAWQVADGTARHAHASTLARDAVNASGGPTFHESTRGFFPDHMALALVEVHKLVPGVAGWDTSTPDSLLGESAPSVELNNLIGAVQQACDHEVDVELIGTGPNTVIDLR